MDRGEGLDLPFFSKEVGKLKVRKIRIDDIDFDHQDEGKKIEEVEEIRKWTKREYGEGYPSIYSVDEWIDMIIEKYSIHPIILRENFFP